MKKLTSLYVAFAMFGILCFVRQDPWVILMDSYVYSGALHLAYSKLWLKFWFVITTFGEGSFVYGVFAFLAGYLMYKKRSVKAFLFVLSATILFFFPVFAKNVFMLERPVCLATFYRELTTYTFPSGHAFNSVILCYFLPRLIREIFFKDKPMSAHFVPIMSRAFGLSGIILISLSRVFLGVHWFSDIIAGVILGVGVSVFLLRYYQARC